MKQGKVKTVLMFRFLLEIPLSLLGQVLFLPFLEILISINYCDKATALVTYVPTLQCKSKEHITHQIVGNVFFILFALLTLLMEYFNIHYQTNIHNVKAKKTTYPEVAMVLLKVFLAAINAVLYDNDYSLFVIGVSFIFALGVCVSFYYYRPYYNNKVMSMHLMNCMLITYSLGVLSVYYFLVKLRLNGGLYLCILGNAVIIVFMLVDAYVSKVRRQSLFMSPSEWKREPKVIEHLKVLELVCDISESFRYCNVLLEGYIGRMEEECADGNCMLKQYLKTKNKKYLFKHIERLYQTAIRRYVNSINIRINYIEFEHTKMHNVKKSKRILDDLLSCSDELTWMNQFLLFQLSKNILNENISSSLHSGNSGSSSSNANKEMNILHNEGNEVFINYAYSTLKNNLKHKITDVVSNYLLFWNVLLSTHKDINQDLSRLSLLGSKIALLNEDITKTYDKLIKINSHNCPMKKLYNLYQQEILHITSQSKAEYDDEDDNYDDNDSITSIISNYMEDNSAKIDTLLSKENKIVIVSGDKPAFGRIVKISTSASSMFGFTKHELLGQHMNVLLPFIIQQPHHDVLVAKAEQQLQRVALVNANTLLYNNNNSNNGSNSASSAQQQHNTHKHVSKEKTIYVLTKSKYLLKATAKVSVIVTETEKIHFIAHFYQEYDSMTTSIATKGQCYVLTNSAFYIENFSSNSEIVLGLRKENVSSHPCDISNLIKEFSDDSLKQLTDVVDNDKDDVTSMNVVIINKHNTNGHHHHHQLQRHKTELNDKDIRKYRKKIILDNFLNSVNPVTWKINTSHVVGSSIISNYENSNNNNNKGRTLYLYLTELNLNNKTYGYIFAFGINDKNILLRKASKKRFVNASSYKKSNDLFDLDKSQQSIKQSFISKCAVCPDFIPEHQKGFFIDIKHMSYKTVPQDEIAKYKQQIQENAIDKIKQFNNATTLTEGDGDGSVSDDDDDDSRSEGSGSSSGSNGSSGDEVSYTSSHYSKELKESKMKRSFMWGGSSNDVGGINNKKKKINFKGEHINKDAVNNDYINNYYKVDVTNIKYMIYDFDRMIVIQVNDNIQSQMQEKIQENTYTTTNTNTDSSGGNNNEYTTTTTTTTKSVLSKRFTDKHLNTPNQQQPDSPKSSTKPESHHSSTSPLTKPPSTTTTNNIFPSYSYMETNPLITRAYFFTDEVILKQISFMLKTKDKHSSVLWLKLISLLIIIVTAIEVALFITSLENAENKGTHYLAVISASSFYFFSSMTAVYHLRELILTNNTNYTNIYDTNRTNYRINNTLELVKVYNMLITSRNAITKHQNILTPQTFNAINNRTVKVYYINQRYEVQTTNVSTTTSLALLQNSLFAITQLPLTAIIPLHPDVSYFLLNAPNSNFEIACTQNTLFLHEYEMHLKRIVMICVFGMVIMWSVNAVLIGVLYYTHSNVIVIREKYLEVFYDLEQETIISCMQKCENFLTQLNDCDNKDNSNNNDSNNNNNNDMFIMNDDDVNVINNNNNVQVQMQMQMQTDINNIINTGSSSSSVIQQQQHKQTSTSLSSSSSSTHKHNRHNRKHNYIMSLLLWICSIVFVLLDISGVLCYQMLSMNMKLNVALLIKSSQQIKMAVVLVFTLLREYIYDPNISFNHSSIHANTLQTLKQQYETYYVEEEYIRSHIERMYPKMLNTFHVLMHRNICSYADAFFTAYHNVTGNCGAFTSNVSYYGFSSLVSYFFMETDELYFKHERFVKLYMQNKFQYNLTLVGTGVDVAYWPSDAATAVKYGEVHPIHLFNDKLHLNICVEFRFLLSPGFTQLGTCINELAKSVRDKMVKIDFGGLLAALVLLVVVYRGIWMRYEEKIEEVIYKTKKMLSIIPIEELVKVRSIKKLLNLEEQGVQKGNGSK